MARREELQEEQWVLVEPLLPKPPRRADGRGRPRCEDRAVLNGNIMDSAFRCPLARRTGPLSLVPDLSSALSGLGAGWHVGARPAGPRRRLAESGAALT